MKIFKILGVVAVVILILGCAGGHRIRLPERPKLAVYWTSPVMSEAEADSLAKFHLVIADMENLVNNPKSLKRLKRRNKELILLCYSNPMEIWTNGVRNRPIHKKYRRLIKNERPGYLLDQPSGDPAIFWKNMRMINLSSWCPAEKGEKYSRFAAEFLLKEVLSDPIWDGYFMDNCTAHIAWIGNYGRNNGLDANNDGHIDNYDQLDLAWEEGVRDFLTRIRQAKGSSFILIGNKGSLAFLDIVDGKMFEEFPNDYLGDKRAGGWYQCLDNYEQIGDMSIIHARQVPNNPEYRSFILASSLMGDGYYAYAQDFFRYFPEYKDIGKPIGEMKELCPGLFERKFEKGVVKVWPEERKGEIVRF